MTPVLPPPPVVRTGTGVVRRSPAAGRTVGVMDHSSPRPRPAVTLALCGAAVAVGTTGVLLAFPGPPAPEVGTLHATAAAVRAPVGGRVVRWLAEPGAAVKPGEPLAEIADVGRLAALAEADREVAAAAAALARAEHAAALDLAWRRAELNRDLHAVRAETAELLRDRFDAELHDVEPPPTDAVPARTVSFRAAAATRSVAAAENAREVLDARLALCEVREAELKDLLSALPSAVGAAAGVPAAAADLAAATDLRDELAAAPASLTVSADRFGSVGRPRVAAGEPVAAGAPLTAVRDAARPFARVSVPTARLSRFHVGAEVTVAFGEGDRRKGYAGRVVAVDPEAAGGVATVRVEPTGPLWPTLPEGAACRVAPAD